MSVEQAATVWAATWVPSPSPIEGYGPEGYSVCWVDLADGTRTQALVQGELPKPGDVGRIREQQFGAVAFDVFERSKA